MGPGGPWVGPPGTNEALLDPQTVFATRFGPFGTQLINTKISKFFDPNDPPGPLVGPPGVNEALLGPLTVFSTHFGTFGTHSAKKNFSKIFDPKGPPRAFG